MKILLINKFLYPAGGDAISTLAAAGLLSSRGHKTVLWGMDHPSNMPLPHREHLISHVDLNRPGSIKDRIVTASNILYSFEAKEKIERIIEIERPDIAHLNNIYHQISPSILHSLKKADIPIVMTLHDYKMVCASYSMMAGGAICEACRDKRFYNCFLKKCVKNSRAKSLLNTLEMYLHHRLLHIYDLVDIFISPSRFLKSKLEEMGFRGKIIYLPNFVDIESFTPGFDSAGKAIVYFGRLSREKGLLTLIEAVKGIKAVSLKVIGDGPLKKELEEKTERENIKNVIFLGHKAEKELKEEVTKSIFVVLPSEWYENNPMSIIESFALGKPVLGAKVGGITELVRDNQTGLVFESGNVNSLRSKIKYLLNNPESVVEMGKAARVFVEKELNQDRYYEKLMSVYGSVERGKKGACR